MSFDYKFHFKSCEWPSVLIDYDALRAYNKWRELARFLIKQTWRNLDVLETLIGKMTKNLI